MTTSAFQRARLSASAQEVFATLPAMGRIMINTRWNGATHERMGAVENVTFENGWAICTGAEHASRIELARIASIIVDRTSIMGGEAYPRLDFHLDDDSVLCSVISFAGLAPFDAALAALDPGEELSIEDKPARGPASEEQPNDPGLVAFERALAGGDTVTIGIERPGFIQSWEGVVEKVSPSRGFINVMRPDFHLHLRMGAVHGWRSAEQDGKLVLFATDADGTDTGLTVRGNSETLAEKALEQAY